MQMRRWVTGSLVAGSVVLALACGGAETIIGVVPETRTKQTGRMIDDPVQGVTYRTNSGIEGVTGPNGEYQFFPGDLVTFSLGTKVLGRTDVPATGILTPMAMAQNPTVLTNLLVLFQSLDNDGYPFNGIVIPPEASAVFNGGMMPLQTDPAQFASTANFQLVAARKAAGITTPIVTPVVANERLTAQFEALFALEIWSVATATEFFVWRSLPDGAYTFGQASPPEGDGRPGVETGIIGAAGIDVWGWVMGQPTVTLDTNGDWGMSQTHPCERVVVEGDKIGFNNCQGQRDGEFQKMPNDPNGIVGAWAMDSPSNIGAPLVLFYSNGKFGVVDPIGDTSPAKCGGPGVEFGAYTYNATTKVLKVSGLQFDTNGCAGLSGSGASTAAGMTFTLGGDAMTATITMGTSRTLYRVSK